MEEFKSQRVKVKLPIKLDAVELGQFARKNVQAITALFEEIRGLRKLAQIKKKEMEEEEKRNARVITTGVDEREVECDQVMNFAQGKVRYIDPKTKKVLLEREMTDAERQLDMFKGYADPAKEKAFKRSCNKCGEHYTGTKRVCFNCQKLDEFKYAPEGA